MSMLIIIGRNRRTGARDFGTGDVRLHDMRWHFQAGRVCYTP